MRGLVFCDGGRAWEGSPADGDSNERSRSSSAGKRCSTERSTFGALGRACEIGDGNGRQDVDASGAGDGPCDDNRGDGEGRGELAAVPLPGTSKLAEEDSTPVATPFVPVLAF